MVSKSHNSFMCAAIIILTAILVTILIAQPSSDNYILKKWAVSSGGGSMSSENYQAVAVIGQSSPPGTSTSTNYTLFSGYLQPLFGAPGAALVWVWTEGDNVCLDWNDVTNATSYNIYRAGDPGVTATPGNLLDTTTNSNYTDTGAAADSVKFFYLVTCSN